jgi:hypothetical protein
MLLMMSMMMIIVIVAMFVTMVVVVVVRRMRRMMMMTLPQSLHSLSKKTAYKTRVVARLVRGRLQPFWPAARTHRRKAGATGGAPPHVREGGL